MGADGEHGLPRSHQRAATLDRGTEAERDHYKQLVVPTISSKGAGPCHWQPEKHSRTLTDSFLRRKLSFVPVHCLSLNTDRPSSPSSSNEPYFHPVLNLDCSGNRVPPNCFLKDPVFPQEHNIVKQQFQLKVNKVLR